MDKRSGRPPGRPQTALGKLILVALNGRTSSWLADEGEWSNQTVTKWIYEWPPKIKQENLSKLAHLLHVPREEVIEAAQAPAPELPRRLRAASFNPDTEAARTPPEEIAQMLDGKSVIRFLLDKIPERDHPGVLRRLADVLDDPRQQKKFLDVLVATLVMGDRSRPSGG